MRVLKTKLSLCRVTEQYMEAKKLDIDIDDEFMYEYKFDPYSLVLDKVCGYQPNPERTKAVGEPCLNVFLGSDYIIIGISEKHFENILKDKNLGSEGLLIIEKVPMDESR